MWPRQSMSTWYRGSLKRVLIPLLVGFITHEKCMSTYLDKNVCRAEHITRATRNVHNHSLGGGLYEIRWSELQRSMQKRGPLVSHTRTNKFQWSTRVPILKDTLEQSPGLENHDQTEHDWNGYIYIIIYTYIFFSDDPACLPRSKTTNYYSQGGSVTSLLIRMTSDLLIQLNTMTSFIPCPQS